MVRILDAYLAALQRGDAPDRETFLAEHPDLAEDLEACLASLEFIRRAADITGGRLLGDDAPPARLGDFRILREAGRGGMGVVYEAEQISLGRRVALKVLPFAAALDPRQLARFRLEAQAAAQLHHTNIVPVFSVGTEQGVHYYAMQFIEGRSLAEVIADLRQRSESGDPSAGRRGFEEAARLGIQAAGALAHAHSLGIVHRDVKPANLLLDTKDTLWVTDFGLARLHDDAGLTMTGDLMGTLRYMSPEQALVRRAVVDERTDIYSLGVTLYELLTLRPALDGQDRQELLRQIAFEEPPPPRKLDPAIPRDLETIVLKAIAKEPEMRYGSGLELADDLRRFLDGRPPQARRPTALERLVRWGRRHPRAVLSGFAGLSLLTVVLAVASIWIVMERARTDREHRLSLEIGQLVLDGITEPLKRMAHPDLSKDPELAEMRRQVVAEAAEAYANYIRLLGEHSETRVEAPSVWIHLGLIRLVDGDHARAVAAFRRAVDAAEAALARDPRSGDAMDLLAQARFTLGQELWWQGLRKEATTEFAEAGRGFARAGPTVWIEPYYLSQYAWFLTLCPDLRFRDPARAVVITRRLVDLTSPRGTDAPRFNPRLRPWFMHGIALYRSGDLEGARAALEKSTELRAGGDGYEWFVMTLIEARSGRMDHARHLYEKAVVWWKWNRYGDIELHLLENECAELLGVPSQALRTAPRGNERSR